MFQHYQSLIKELGIDIKDLAKALKVKEEDLSCQQIEKEIHTRLVKLKASDKSWREGWWHMREVVGDIYSNMWKQGHHFEFRTCKENVENNHIAES